MARALVANRGKLSLTLSWKLSRLVLRGGLRRLRELLIGHPLLRWRLGPIKADRLLIAPQELRTADATRATEIYAGRFAFAGKVVVCDERSIFEMAPPSEEWAGGAAWVYLAPSSARRRIRHHPRQRAGVGRRMDRAAGVVASAGMAGRRVVAAHHLLAQPGAAGFAGRRCPLLPAFPAQPGAAGPLPAPHRRSRRPRRRPHAGDHRAHLCRAVHCRSGAHHQIRNRPAEQRNRAADPARRRPCQPRSGRDYRTAA